MLTFHAKANLSGTFRGEPEDFEDIVHESVENMLFELKDQLHTAHPEWKVGVGKQQEQLDPSTQSFKVTVQFNIQIADAVKPRYAEVLQSLRNKLRADERILHDFVLLEEDQFPDDLFSDVDFTLLVHDPIPNRTRRNIRARTVERLLQGTRLSNNVIGEVLRFTGPKRPEHAPRARPLPPALSNSQLAKGPNRRMLNALHQARQTAYTRSLTRPTHFSARKR